jgi:hypothetical protein
MGDYFAGFFISLMPTQENPNLLFVLTASLHLVPSIVVAPLYLVQQRMP